LNEKWIHVDVLVSLLLVVVVFLMS
jgi:hypothetical protein